MANLLLAVIYIAFISLGLPDAVLGAAWPTMSGDLHAPISWAGGISMTISAGTIVSALLSDRITLRFGAGKVTAVSVALTAFALFGFSISSNYWMLLLGAQQLCGNPLRKPSHELAARHVGLGHSAWPVHHGKRIGCRPWLGVGLPDHLHSAGRAHRGAGAEPAVVEGA